VHVLLIHQKHGNKNMAISNARHTGVVKVFNDQRGYGFIEPSTSARRDMEARGIDSTSDVYVFFQNIRKASVTDRTRRSLAPGETVSFCLGKAHNSATRLQAIDVTKQTSNAPAAAPRSMDMNNRTRLHQLARTVTSGEATSDATAVMVEQLRCIAASVDMLLNRVAAISTQTQSEKHTVVVSGWKGQTEKQEMHGHIIDLLNILHNQYELPCPPAERHVLINNAVATVTFANEGVAEAFQDEWGKHFVDGSAGKATFMNTNKWKQAVQDTLNGNKTNNNRTNTQVQGAAFEQVQGRRGFRQTPASTAQTSRARFLADDTTDRPRQCQAE